MKITLKIETLLTAVTTLPRVRLSFATRTIKGFVFNGVFMKTLMLFAIVILISCQSPNEPTVPEDFIDYKPFTLASHEKKIFAHIDNVDLSITYNGTNVNGWVSLTWDKASGGIFEPKYCEGKDLYFNYAILKNANAKMRFLKIQENKITMQCIELIINGEKTGLYVLSPTNRK